MKHLFLLVIVSLMVLSCSKEEVTNEDFTILKEESPVIADFNFESDIVNENQDLKINNLSSGATEYLWDFGENQILKDEVPDFKYLIHGIYEVKLTVKNENGSESSVIKQIEVLCNFGGGNHGTQTSEF
jgi:PKD repeat protein